MPLPLYARRAMNNNLSTKEAADFLGVSVGTIERWRKSNQGPPYFQKGRVIRYGLEDLKDWVNLHKRA